MGSFYQFAILEDDAFNHGLDKTKEYQITYEIDPIAIGGCALANACDWLTIRTHNFTVNGVIPMAFDTNNCECIVTQWAIDEGGAKRSRTLTITSYNTPPYGNDAEICVFDGQPFSYDVNEEL